MLHFREQLRWIEKDSKGTNIKIQFSPILDSPSIGPPQPLGWIGLLPLPPWYLTSMLASLLLHAKPDSILEPALSVNSFRLLHRGHQSPQEPPPPDHLI